MEGVIMFNRSPRTPRQNKIIGIVFLIVGFVFLLGRLFSESSGLSLALGIVFIIIGMNYFRMSRKGNSSN